MAQQKIKPLLHHSISLTFQRDLDVLRKQRKNTARTFSIKVSFKKIDANPVNNLFELNKITKAFKVIKTANLQDLSFNGNTLHNKPRCSSKILAKRMLRVESLSIRDTFSKELPLQLGIWLQRAKRIKKVDYLVREQQNVPVGHIDRRVRRLSGWLDSIKIKELSIDTDFCNYNSPFFFHKLPRSLKKLALSSMKYIAGSGKNLALLSGVTNSIQKLTNLQALHLKTNEFNEILASLLNSIPCPSQLTTLDFDFQNHEPFKMTTIIPFLQKLSGSARLKRLYLAFSSCPEHLDKLFEAIKSSSLTEFSFSAEPTTQPQWDSSLFAFISSLKKLKCFKLALPCSPPIQTKFINAQFTAELMEILKKMMKNSSKLETFALDYPISVESSHFEGLIEMLRTRPSFLKTLRISFKELQLTNSQFQKTFQTLREFEKLEELDLTEYVITGKTCVEEIIDWCYKAKNLRALYLGEIRNIGSKEIFAELMKRILSKRGLGSFRCTPSKDLRMSYGRKVEGMPYIDVNLIRQKNPFLEYPDLSNLLWMDFLYI